MPSFKVPCPSCEAPVLIKNPNLVGTKVECPKCKYRFKVEEPAADATATGGDAKKPDAKDKKADAKEKKEKKAKTPGKNKKLVKIGVGIGAVLVLIVVGSLVLGGGDDKKKPSSNPGQVGPVGPGPNPNPGPGDPDTKPKDKDAVDPGPPPVPYSTKNTTHLLPGQAVAVYRFNLDRLRQTPIYESLASQQIEKMFTASMGFTLADVEIYYHCFSGDNRDPFGVIKLKNPAKPETTTAKLQETKTLVPKPTAVKKYTLYAIRSNPFVNAVSHALSKSSMLGEFYDTVPMTTPADARAKPMGVCVYDNQHIFIGDYALLQRFLGELDAEGYPPFKIELIATSAAPPGTVEPVPMPGTPGMPPTPPVPPKQPDPKQPDPKKVDPKKDAKKDDAKKDDAKKADSKKGEVGEKPLTSVDTYRTLEFPLKKALEEMEGDQLNTPVFVYAEKFGADRYDTKRLRKEYHFLAATLEPVFERTRYLSMNVMAFTQRQLTANIRFTLNGETRVLAKDYVGPALERMADVLKLYLATSIEFRDYTQGGNTNTPETGTPQFPKGPGTPPFPPPMPPTGMPPEMVPGMPPPEKDPAPAHTTSHIDLGMTDKQLLIAIDLNWQELTYRTLIAPRMVSLANELKGKMAIFSQDFSWHAVAAAGPRAAEELKQFPRGTVDRGSTVNRFGLPYPPVQRCSLFVDLLPYLGRGDLKFTLSPKLAWYDEKNLPVPGMDRAGAWVPELLVPYYPQSAWRATSPLAPDHVFGATNYVAIAGVGLDTPRLDPTHPDFKKKAGITGYGWGSKVEDITDGLSNTIYMMQTPPGLQQPWIAGGGATVRGLNENDPMAGFRYGHPDGGDGFRQGTYVLMADGSVRWIPASIDPKVLRAMATRAGGESLADIDKHTTLLEAPKVELKKPEEKKPEEKKPADPKATDPKKSDDKKDPGAKLDPAPAPKEK